MNAFRPSMLATLVLLGLAAACASLSAWQWQRAEQQSERLRAMASATQHDALPPPATAGEFARVWITGHFDEQRHVLVDNQVLDGRAGVHVYTPFYVSGGTVVLVNRGWLPLPPSRTPLPEVRTPSATLLIHGRLRPFPGTARQLGEPGSLDPSNWPQLVTYPSMERIGQALQTSLYPIPLFLDTDSDGGFDGRNWPAVYMTPERHQAYAFQWGALALLSVICWAVAGRRRARQGPAA